MAKKKFTIDRKNWLTSQNLNKEEKKKGYDRSCLKNPHTGKMCCLGFICNQSGVSENYMLGIGDPRSLWYNESNQKLKEELEEKIGFLLADKYDNKVNKSFVEEAISINDDSLKSISKKEADLIELFAEHDIELEFVGEYDVEQT